MTDGSNPKPARRKRGASRLYRVALGTSLRSETVGVMGLQDAYRVARAYLAIHRRAPVKTFTDVRAELDRTGTWTYPAPGRWVRAWARIELVRRVSATERATAQRRTRRRALAQDLGETLAGLMADRTPSALDRCLPGSAPAGDAASVTPRSQTPALLPRKTTDGQ